MPISGVFKVSYDFQNIAHFALNAYIWCASGLQSLRVGHDGKPLPSPRSLSSATVVNRDDVYEDYTLFVMQWGQFLDHDLTHTPITKGGGNTRIQLYDGNMFLVNLLLEIMYLSFSLNN